MSAPKAIERKIKPAERDRETASLGRLSGWKLTALVSFGGALIVATLLAAFSAREFGDLGNWWLAALLSAVGCWLLIAGCSALWSWWIGRSGFVSRDAPRWARFATLGGCGAAGLLLIGLIPPLSSIGLLLSLWPLLLVVAFLWSRDGRVDRGLGITAGVAVFLIFMRLFTLPGDEERNPPNFSKPGKDDVRVLSWNIGGGPPGFGVGREEDIGAIARIIKEQDAHVVCLQEVSSQGFVDALVRELGADWRGQRSKGEGRASAVLSRISGQFESPPWAGDYGAPIVLTINSSRGALQFVSCHAPAGRKSGQRRATVDWVLNSVRDTRKKTVVAGDFGIDPDQRWSFLAPLLTDAASFDRATWRALNVLGTDPGLGGGSTGLLGRRTDWVIVDSKMSVADYRVLESARLGSMDHSPVVVVVGLGRAGREPEAEAHGAPRQALIDKQL